MRYENLSEFTGNGLEAFEKAFTGQIAEDAVDLTNPAIVRSVPGTTSFEVKPFETARDLSTAVIASLGSRSVPELLSNAGFWAWLTFVLRDVVFPRDKAGQRQLGEIHRWYPGDPNDYQKAQRHLVRMPVTLLSSLGENADHLLCGKPSVHGDVREQLTGQQDMFHPGFQGMARILYYDEEKKKLKPGAGGKGPGSARRLARTRRQFDVTWDLFVVPPDRLLEMLPRQYDRFKKSHAQPPSKDASLSATARTRPAP